MLLEPGPLVPFTSAEIPTPGPAADLAGPASVEAGELSAAKGALEIGLVAFLTAGDNALQRTAGADLAAIAGELGSQAGYYDPAIGNVAAAANGGETSAAGLLGEISQDLYTAVFPAVTIPPEDYQRTLVPGLPYTGWDSVVAQSFGFYYGRSATPAELAYARRFEPDLEALRAWIRAGAVMDGSPAPAPPPEPPSGGGGTGGALTPEQFDAGVNDLFREIGGRDAFDGEIAYARVYYPDLGAVRAWILAGTPT